MGRSLTGIIVLAPLALLGACLEMVPRAPFHATAEREMRYAAEVTLAVKENRRDEVSEAAANGRLVLPQMPEVWASSPAYDARKRTADEERLALLDAGTSPEVFRAAPRCAGLWRDRREPDDCAGRSPGAGPELPPLFPAAIAPTAASEVITEATSWPIP